MTENETTVVEEKTEDAVPEATTEQTSERESSPEVKVEVPDTGSQEKTPENVQQNDVDIAKMQDQINNLNKALKQERESGKTQSQELKEELARSKETIDKLKNVFSPEQPTEEPQENLTMSQVEKLLEEKEAQRKEELQKESQAQAIKTEVSTLEKEWNGKEGKPKYDDKKVLDWQEENNKLHLSPREAFNEMSRNEIIDWEIKNRMNKKPEVKNVETPGGTPTAREPQGKSPTNTADLRSAILEAMDIASGDSNN